jgi:hypothetical protein
MNTNAVIVEAIAHEIPRKKNTIVIFDFSLKMKTKSIVHLDTNT